MGKSTTGIERIRYAGKSVEASYPISPGIYSIIIADQYRLCKLKRAIK